MQPLIRLLCFLACGLVLGASMLGLGSLWAALFGWVFCIMLAALCSKRMPSVFELSSLGFVALLCGSWWLLPVIVNFAEVGVLIAVILVLLYAALGSLQFAAVGLLSAFFEKRVGRSIVVLPVAWVTAELFFPRVFPWALGHTQLAITPVAQVADLFGVSLISALMLWWSTSILATALGSRPVRSCIAACLSIFAVLGYGLMRSSEIEAEAKTGREIRIAAVQANLDPSVDFQSEKVDLVPVKYRELSSAPITEAPLDLLIWPESSIAENYAPDVNQVLPGTPEDPFPGLDVPLLFGGQTALNSGDGYKRKLFNSLFLAQRDRQFSSYHKQFLFPLGERIPRRETCACRKAQPRSAG